MSTNAEENSLDLVIYRLDTIDDRLKEVLADHEKRLRSVEKWVCAVPPTLLLAATSVIAAVVTGGG